MPRPAASRAAAAAVTSRHQFTLKPALRALDGPVAVIVTVVPETAGTLTWKVGDTCYLKSGSPRMVIVVADGEMLSLAWTQFNEGAPYTLTVPSACVQKDWK